MVSGGKGKFGVDSRESTLGTVFRDGLTGEHWRHLESERSYDEREVTCIPCWRIRCSTSEFRKRHYIWKQPGNGKISGVVNRIVVNLVKSYRNVWAILWSDLERSLSFFGGQSSKGQSNKKRLRIFYWQFPTNGAKRERGHIPEGTLGLSRKREGRWRGLIRPDRTYANRCRSLIFEREIELLDLLCLSVDY